MESSTSGGLLACLGRRPLSAPLLSCTQTAVKSERGRKSKIRARQSTRNHESYTLIAAEQRRNAVREQEVFHQKVGHPSQEEGVKRPERPGTVGAFRSGALVK